MSEENNATCTRPTTTVPSQPKKLEKENLTADLKEDKKNMVMVGKPAPTFTAPAFFNGKFTKINLEDFKGKWVLLCFYPGDFTFV